MNKRKLLLLSSGLLVVVLLAGVVGATAVFAQETPPESEPPAQQPGHPGRGGLEGGLFAGGPGENRWTAFDAAAEALGLTPEALFSELHGGKSVEEIAEEQGVDVEDVKEAVQEAVRAARSEAMRQRIEQAVEEGKMDQEQADWLLEGLDQGFFPGGRGFGFGRNRRQGGFGPGRPGAGGPTGEPAPNQ